MSEAFELTTFDGNSIGPETVYNCMLAEEDDIVVSGEVASQLRRSAGPLVLGASSPGRVIVVRSDGPDNDDPAAAGYRQSMDRWFDPTRNRDGLRYLVRYADDGETLIRIGCFVTEKRFSGRGANAYVITLFAPAENWEAVDLSTSDPDPATVINAGNAVAYPILELTNDTHVTRRACTVTGAGAGGGLIAYPVKFVLQAGIPVVSSSTANPSVISTSPYPHGFTTSDSVIISGHSDASINGTHTVTVTSNIAFTIPVDGATNGAGTGGTAILASDYDADVETALSGLSASNFAVYVEGVSVPFYAVNSGLATYIWALIDTASDGTTATNVDIIAGSGISNALANTLNDGGMGWDDHTLVTNGAWQWDDWASVTSNPPRAGVWRPALTGNHSDAANASYAITSEATGSIVISLGADGTYDNSADSIRLHVGAKAGTSSALGNLRRVTASLDGTNARAYVRYRVANSTTWVDAWTATTNATVTTAIDLDNAVEIVVGLENFGGTADPATLTISPTSDVKLTLASTPTVVVGALADMDIYNGTYTIGDRSITFTDFIVPDGTLSIDCGARSISSSVAGPFYGDEDALTFSDPDQWLILEPGSNTVTDGLSVTDVVKHRGSYA